MVNPSHRIAWDKAYDGLTPLRRQLLEKEIEQAIRDERRACAGIAVSRGESDESLMIAAAIRARKE